MTEPQIRAEMLLSLADLYEDILTRNQYKRFRFQGGDNRHAQKVLSGLRSHQIVVENGSCAVRLTNAGYKLNRDKLAFVLKHSQVGRNFAIGTISHPIPSTRKKSDASTTKWAM